VQLIVAARAEQPFTSLEEMLEREVLDRGQLEDVRDLVTF
jgi:DNA uptake protein ComE-like DNA-binding protein